MVLLDLDEQDESSPVGNQVRGLSGEAVLEGVTASMHGRQTKMRAASRQLRFGSEVSWK